MAYPFKINSTQKINPTLIEINSILIKREFKSTLNFFLMVSKKWPFDLETILRKQTFLIMNVFHMLWDLFYGCRDLSHFLVWSGSSLGKRV